MTVATEPAEIDKDFRSLLLSDDAFWPAEPKTIVDTGLSSSFIEGLICKSLATCGTMSGLAVMQLSASVLAEVPTATVIPTAQSDLIVCHEVENLDVCRVAAQLVDRRRDYVDLAKRLHTARRRHLE